jgi:hypothetical protein
MEPTLLRAAVRLAVTSPLSIKPHRRSAWCSHGRHRVRKRSSRVAVASPPLLGAAARMHAGRSHGRHRVRQRSRVAFFFLFPVASLRLLGAAAAIHASLAAAAKYAWRCHGRQRVRQRSSRVGVLFSSLSHTFTACATVIAAPPSPPVDSSAPPKQFFFCGLVFSSCFLPAEVRSGPMAVPDRLSCFRGEGCTTRQADRKKKNF